MIDPTKPLIDPTLNNNKKTMPVGGFNAHPENINRNGRPKKEWTWSQLLEEAAEEIFEVKDKQGKVTARKALKQLVARKLLTEAANGNVGAAKEIMNRMDGMPMQATDITSQGEKLQQPLVIMDIKPKDK